MTSSFRKVSWALGVRLELGFEVKYVLYFNHFSNLSQTLRSVSQPGGVGV